MIRSKLKEKWKFLFLPAFLLTALLSLSSRLFIAAQNTLQATQQIPYNHIPHLKVLAIYPQVIFVVALLLAAKRMPFEKLFKKTLLILIGLVSLSLALLLFKEGLPFEETAGIYTQLLANWPVSQFYIVSSLFSSSLFSILIWGFINRHTTLLEGMRVYLPLAFLFSLFSLISLLPLEMKGWSIGVLGIPAIGLMACALLAFNRAEKKIPRSFATAEESSFLSPARFPFFSAAYLLAGGLMVANLLQTLFKPQLMSLFPTAAAYQTAMGTYSLIAGFSTLLISMGWVLLGTRVLQKKGWRTAALSGSLAIFIGGLGLLVTTALGLFGSEIDQGLYRGLLLGTTSTLFFPLVQIAYLHLPRQNRFGVKVVTEMIGLPVMKSIPSLFTQGLIVTFGSFSAITPYLQIPIPLLMVGLLVASQRMGRFQCLGPR